MAARICKRCGKRIAFRRRVPFNLDGTRHFCYSLPQTPRPNPFTPRDPEVEDSNLDKRQHYVYTDLLDFAADAEKRIGTHPRSRGRVKEHHSEGFTMSRSWDDSKDLMHRGWPEGVERLSHAFDALPFFSRPADDFMLGPDPSDLYDIGAICAGHPDSYLQVVEGSNAKRRIVTIAINISISCGFSTEHQVARGSLVTALVAALESRGVRCEVWAIFKSAYDCMRRRDNSPSNIYRIDVKVKDAEAILNLDTLAFTLMHPAFCRAYCFAHHDGCAKWDSCYLYPTPMTEDECNAYDVCLGEGSYWTSKEATVQFLKEQLQKLGIDVDEESQR